MDTTHTIPTARHDLTRQLSRRAIAFIAVLALALTLVGPTVQPADAQIRGGVNVSCEASQQFMRISLNTNALQHVLVIRRWDGQRWVAIGSTATTSSLLVVNAGPGHYRVDVAGYTSASGWQWVSPVRYESRMAGWAAPYRISYDYCTVRRYYF